MGEKDGEFKTKSQLTKITNDFCSKTSSHIEKWRTTQLKYISRSWETAPGAP